MPTLTPQEYEWLKKKERRLGRSEGYVEFVAAYLRLFGWGVEVLKRIEGEDDRGDMLCERNGKTMTVDVKENSSWRRGSYGRGRWFPHPDIALTSPDQIHHEWVYCVVATDMHALAFIDMNDVPKDKLVERGGWNECNQVDHTFLCAPLEYAAPRSIHISGRPI
jgi:hypothetical protein